VPADILGFKNAPIREEIRAPIQLELWRIARSASAGTVPAATAVEQYVTKLREEARPQMSPLGVADMMDALESILGKSKSWQNGAYVIAQTDPDRYVQFMSSPDGTEILFEIVSHKYQPNVEEHLTAEAVDVIERSGFVWPTRTANFRRWCNVGSPEDLQVIAELALAVLARVFGIVSDDALTLSVHIPT
jgi:hypothetical protein